MKASCGGRSLPTRNRPPHVEVLEARGVKMVCQIATDKIVNVATVPLRSPFRYPGGKTWLVPLVRQWLSKKRTPSLAGMIEPFAGGGIVSLTAAFEGLVPTVTLVELDSDVAAVWQTMLNGHGEWLADSISAFVMTPENLHAALAEADKSVHHRAFATILKNRTRRGGILAPGAGFVKEGENGRGLSSRWYPETLRRRILEIAARKEQIRFVQGDGIEYMKQNADRPDLAFFIDPPYTVAGRRLYTLSEIDHAALFDAAAALAGDFLITYDSAEEIARLADRHGFQTALVPMKSTHHERKMELLIGRDLSWLDGSSEF